LTAFEATLPAGITLERGFDQAENVEHRLSGFVRDFALAIALVLLTLLPLGVRASLVVMVSIPTSLAVGLTLLKALGYSINQLSIVGFVIALGLLVDDSVVVVENIARFVRNGVPPVKAAIDATKQITVSVLGCTATLLFAFLPLLFLPGTAGQFIRSMPVAVVVTIAASLLVSLTIVPFLASRLLKADGHEHGNVVFRAMTWLIEGSYRRVLNRAIAWPKTTVVVAAAVFAGSLLLVPKIGFSLFPKANLPQFLITIEAPEGSSLAETDRIAREVEAVIAKHQDVENVATNVGKGNPRIYYNIAQRDARPNYAEVFAELRNFEPKKSGAELEAIRGELGQIAGARIQLKELENGPPLDAPIAMRVLGTDPEKIEKVAAEIEAKMATVPGTRTVRNPAKDKRTDLRVAIDRQRAAALGISNPDVDRAVRLALSGARAAAYRLDGREDALDVRVTIAPSEASEEAFARAGWVTSGMRPGLAELDRIFVPTPQGAVPLSAVATLELEPSATTLRHYKRERTALVTAEVEPGANTDRVTKAVLAEIATLEPVAGVRVVPAGEIESRQESFGGLGAAILIAAFGVLSVLVLEFRTFKSTLIVA
ncbi:MAG: efflux RND transporter permease subunit, partial [Myxococcales bacterium]|nr:efflux RND transporter permease subunit [Myxococcales bacterium]